MKIYFSGSIKGGRDHQEWYEYIVLLLQSRGEVLTEFVSDKNLTSYGTVGMTDKEIYDRDVALIIESDIMIADITTPSLGVGYEISYAENLNKRICCLYHSTPGKRVSSMIVGNSKFEIFPYETREDINKILDNIFKK